MPANVVKTPADEKHWAAAKAKVKEEYPDVDEGDDRFYKLVMGIFQRMKHKTGSRKPPTAGKSFAGFVADLRKARVRAHYRTINGKRVRVSEYETKRPAARVPARAAAGFRGQLFGPREEGELWDDRDEPLAPECPECGGPGAYLGALGSREHFRCINCGMEFSREEDKGPESEEMEQRAQQRAQAVQNIPPARTSMEGERAALLRDLPDRGRYIATIQAELESMARGAGLSPFDKKVARAALQNIQDWTEAMSDRLFDLGVDAETSRGIFAQMDEAYEQRGFEMKSGGLRNMLYNEDVSNVLRRHSALGRRLRAEALDMGQAKSFAGFLDDLRKGGNVKGHYRTVKGKRVWVKEHSTGRAAAKPKQVGGKWGSQLDTPEKLAAYKDFRLWLGRAQTASTDKQLEEAKQRAKDAWQKLQALLQADDKPDEGPPEEAGGRRFARDARAYHAKEATRRKETPPEEAGGRRFARDARAYHDKEKTKREAARKAQDEPDFEKSRVKGHYRTVGGKRVWVREHTTKTQAEFLAEGEARAAHHGREAIEENAPGKKPPAQAAPDWHGQLELLAHGRNHRESIGRLARRVGQLQSMKQMMGEKPDDEPMFARLRQQVQWVINDVQRKYEQVVDIALNISNHRDALPANYATLLQRKMTEWQSTVVQPLRTIAHFAGLAWDGPSNDRAREGHKSFAGFLGSLRKARVRAHYRTVDGKRVRVEEYEQRRMPAKPKTKGSPRKAEKKRVLPKQPARPEWLPLPAYNRMIELGGKVKALNANQEMPWSEKKPAFELVHAEAQRILAEHGTTPERRETLMGIGRQASGTKKAKPKTSWEARHRRKEITAAKKYRAARTKASPRRPEHKEADIGGTNTAPPAPKSKASPKKKPALPPAGPPVPTYNVGQVFEKVGNERWTGQSLENRPRYRYTIESIDAETGAAMVRLTHERGEMSSRWKRRVKTTAKPAQLARLRELVEAGNLREVSVEEQAKDTAKEKGPTFSLSELRTIFREAAAAGKKAGDARTPEPMYVVERESPIDDSSPIVGRYPPVMGGVCGFAWVTVYPGNSQAANYAKKHYGGYTSYHGGMVISVDLYGQSYEKKTAYAGAFAARLCEAGIKAYAGGRLD